MKLITANRLSDGAVVYLGAGGAIVDRFDHAQPITMEAAASALAAAAERSGEIVGAYIIAVDGASPTGREALRETIRMNGPTIRNDLGKQAEARDERL